MASGVQVARALRKAGHEVAAVDTTRGVLSQDDEDAILGRGVEPGSFPPGPLDLLASGGEGLVDRASPLRRAEMVFPVLHGGAGEDGTLQALLDLLEVPYVGSGRLGCALAMDKEISKRLFRDEGIPTPPWVVQEVRGSGGTTDPDEGESPSRSALEAEVLEVLDLPLIVKPPSGGSTLGLTLVRDAGELRPAVEESLKHEDRVLFEAYVAGRELTVGVVGDEALPVGEIIPQHELFDYECKYQPGMAEEIFPARIPSDLANHLQELSLRVHRLLRLSDFSRVDFMVDEAGGAWCLEANALPGMTSNSLLPKAAHAAGIPFPELCHRILEAGASRYPRAGSPSGT